METSADVRERRRNFRRRDSPRRGYRIWGKKSLGDADWTQIDAASTADYNFFKVTVEMK